MKPLDMVILILVVVITLLVLVAMAICLLWLVHLLESKKRTGLCSYGWGNYKKFKREFNKKEKWWSMGDSVLLSNGGSIRPFAYEFDNKMMIINNPISYILVEFYIYKYFEKISCRAKTKVKW